MKAITYIDPELAAQHRQIAFIMSKENDSLKEESDEHIYMAIMLSSNIEIYLAEYILFWSLEHALCYRKNVGFYLLDADGYPIDKTDRNPMSFEDGLKMWIAYSE